VAAILAHVLIEKYAPTADASELHRIEIEADVQSVYQCLWSADLAGSAIIKTLMGLRALPALLLHPTSLHLKQSRWRRTITMQSLIDSGFAKLAEDPGRELVLGIVGRFWRPTGNVSPYDETNFNGPVPVGLARAIWNFHLQQSGPGRTMLSTETRVVCGDAASRAKFRTYWLFVRPFSGLIRRLMLNSVKRKCETTFGRQLQNRERIATGSKHSTLSKSEIKPS
jgi:hypothetical protein